MKSSYDKFLSGFSSLMANIWGKKAKRYKYWPLFIMFKWFYFRLIFSSFYREHKREMLAEFCLCKQIITLNASKKQSRF